MKVGNLVRHNFMFGIIIELNPFGDGLHTTILWADDEEPGGTIESVWCNEDFQVIS